MPLPLEEEEDEEEEEEEEEELPPELVLLLPSPTLAVINSAEIATSSRARRGRDKERIMPLLTSSARPKKDRDAPQARFQLHVSFQILDFQCRAVNGMLILACWPLLVLLAPCTLADGGLIVYAEVDSKANLARNFALEVFGPIPGARFLGRGDDLPSLSASSSASSSPCFDVSVVTYETLLPDCSHFVLFINGEGGYPGHLPAGRSLVLGPPFSDVGTTQHLFVPYASTSFAERLNSFPAFAREVDRRRARRRRGGGGGGGRRRGEGAPGAGEAGDEIDSIDLIDKQSGTAAKAGRNRRFAVYLSSRCFIHREAFFDALSVRADALGLGDVAALGTCRGKAAKLAVANDSGQKPTPTPTPTPAAAAAAAAAASAAQDLEQRHTGRDLAGWQDEAVALHRGYDFAIAFENKVESGYVTEKIVNAFAAGAVPIYLGDPATVVRLFNPAAMVMAVADPATGAFDIEGTVDRVVQVAQNQTRYREMRNAPVFAPGGELLFSWVGKRRRGGQDGERYGGEGKVDDVHEDERHSNQPPQMDLARRLRNIAAHFYLREALGIEALYRPFRILQDYEASEE